MRQFYTQHLHRSESYIYYYRRAIPEAYRAFFAGKREIKKSLGTRAKTEAIIRLHLFAVQIDFLFWRLKTMAKKGVPDLSKLDPNKLLGLTVASADGLLPNQGRIHLEGITFDPNNLEADIEAFNKIMQGISPEVTAIAAKPQPAVQPFPQTATPEAEVVTPAPRTQDNEPPKPKLPPLSKTKISKVIDEFFIFFPNMNPKTKDANIAIYQVFIGVNGDIPIGDVDDRMMSQFAKILKTKIPSNCSKIYPGKTIKQIIAMKHTGRTMMSVTTINKYISRLGKLFNFACRQGYITKNPAEGKGFASNINAKKQRQKFSINDLKLIFEQGDIYHSHMQSKHTDIYWACLISLFSGMRLNEIWNMLIRLMGWTKRGCRRYKKRIALNIIRRHHSLQIREPSSSRVAPRSRLICSVIQIYDYFPVQVFLWTKGGLTDTVRPWQRVKQEKILAHRR